MFGFREYLEQRRNVSILYRSHSQSPSYHVNHFSSTTFHSNLRLLFRVSTCDLNDPQLVVLTKQVDSGSENLGREQKVTYKMKDNSTSVSSLYLHVRRSYEGRFP